MKCLNCGTENPENAKFCIECGQKMIKQIKCPSCGTIVVRGKFCPECGARLDNSGSARKPEGSKGIFDSDFNEVYDGMFGKRSSGLAAAKEAENKKYAERNKKLETARRYIKNGDYYAAGKVYDQLAEEYPTDMEVYMGYIRVVTENYTVYAGDGIDKSIRVAQRISGREDLSVYDSEFAGYIERREKYNKKKASEEEEELDPFLLFLLGVGYTMGSDEVAVDMEQAVIYYRKAADLGNQQAQCALASCYEEGSGVAKNLAEAVKWYKKAAANGSSVAKDKLKELGY